MSAFVDSDSRQWNLLNQSTNTLSDMMCIVIAGRDADASFQPPYLLGRMVRGPSGTIGTVTGAGARRPGKTLVTSFDGGPK